jgi:hypothetical protein
MRRRKDGLWFTTKPTLLPNAPAPETSTENSARPSINSVITATWTTPLSKAQQHLKLWHQRLGHAAPRTLKRTQQVVDGIPNLPDAYPLFCCPFYDKAKLRKNHDGKNSMKEAFAPGTAFHMELVFYTWPQELTGCTSGWSRTKRKGDQKPRWIQQLPAHNRRSHPLHMGISPKKQRPTHRHYRPIPDQARNGKTRHHHNHPRRTTRQVHES